MCAPIEIPGTLSVITRLTTIKITSWFRTWSTPRRCASVNAAPISPKIAPDAPAVWLSGETMNTPNDPASSPVK